MIQNTKYKHIRIRITSSHQSKPPNSCQAVAFWLSVAAPIDVESDGLTVGATLSLASSEGGADSTIAEALLLTRLGFRALRSGRVRRQVAEQR